MAVRSVLEDDAVFADHLREETHTHDCPVSRCGPMLFSDNKFFGQQSVQRHRTTHLFLFLFPLQAK